ncbi:TMV resistance protein N-like isoform X3 [Solanum stenotomum]|uniref:TMV resistance protein N-like isoform X3 n=1 Tax=Solanum stenotomum TaxID=172797 RepID=UPI0020D0778E|nr:TMV resistance protein N-like isoform X3 [Solanum stenotomum]
MIEMHDPIAQMGQQVARDAEQGKPWNCSRLWHEKDMNTVFSANQIARTHTFSVAPQNEDQKWKYDAFLSFRGDDTRNNFVAHLYKRLQDIGINVFKDDVKLERGKFISTELLKAIEESRTAIIIFSEDYASSSWCLEELTMIMECVDKKEQKAYPVFYNVEPSDIRMKTLCEAESSSFAKALEKHREDFKANFEKLATKHEADLALRKKDETNQKDNLVKVQRWKDTLHRAAGIAGLDVRKTANGDEAKSIDKIINDNFRNMHHTVSATEKYLVGIESRMGEVESLLKFRSGDVYFIGIWGIGGVGKTTVARKYFDRVSHQFQVSCFLANVREESKKHGLMYLQKTLLSRLLKEKSMNITSFYEGADMIKRRLCHWKVLIVFDDVDDEDQLEYLVGNHDWFGGGSIIITTTRNQDLLRRHDQSYSVPELAKDEAIEVFSWHAFQKPTPDKEFLKLSKSVVDYAKGLPLALKVLGSFLYKRGSTEWRSALDRLKDSGYEKIAKQLSLSLDGLSHEEKNIFLDMACFFRGRKRDDVITILNSFGFRSEIGTDILIQKSLLYISEGMVEMHDLIEQMGQQVVRNVDLDKPWNLSRLWHEQDIKTVFSANQIARTHTFSVAPQNEANQKWKYDAFLSFRGDDTRNNFVAHLFKRLQDIGINVFKDDVKLERGKIISTELLKAIEESRTAIIIFSEDYASSTWCLEELTMIMECVDKKEQKAYPIFYNVEPSDIRMKTKSSSFAKALEKHREDFKANFEEFATKHEADLALRKKNETNYKDNLEKVQRWKDALHRAAGIAGLDVRKTANGNEAESIDKIINDNFQIMHHSVSATEKCLVGIESRMGEVESLFKVRSGDVCFVGIWGIGGIGKTTVARTFFDKISCQFQGSCFLANVREESKKHGLTYLQDTLLSRILNEKRMNIASFYEGADMIKRRLCHWKVLIVFDDVDDEHQLEYLVGNHDWFGEGSIIITTTRNQDLLRSHDRLYSVPELAKDEAIEVFSWHAFQKQTPDKEFLELSKSVVDYAKGLPLALKVLGSFLYKRGVTEWRSAIDRLRDTGYEKIVKQLSLSLDGLNHEEKNVFLDIACFFRGRKKDDVITILNSFGFRSEIGIDVLIQKSLLYISEGNVEMHDLIEQMGQQVARNVDHDKPWKHSRLWHEQDIKTVFSADQKTESIKGIMVPIGSDQHICKWSKAFRNMPCLRLLIVKGEEVWHHDLICDPIECLPSNLKWLDWSYYSFESLPAYYEPGNLVGLHMTFSSLVEVVKEPKAFDKLTVLNLSFSRNLIRTPNFSEIPNLQRIILKSCVSLVEIHPSIGQLRKVIILNMENCKNLKSLPSSIQMESLEIFNLSGCEKLEKFPEIQGNMELLSELLLAHTAIWELPSSVGLLSGINLLDLHSCKNLVRLPASVSEMRKLKILSVKGCSRLANFPENLGDLTQLEELYAGNTAIWQLPDSLLNLSKLKVLSLRRSRKVKRQTGGSLMLPPFWESHDLRELKSLDLSGCNLSDNQTGALMNFPSLLELNLSRNKFISLPDVISRLSQLRYLNITQCQELKKLPKLPPSVEELYAEDFLAKQSIAMLQRYHRLNLVSFTNYSFDQQSYTEESNGSSVLDEILYSFLSRNMDYVVHPSLNSDYRVTCSIVFPGCVIPMWFKHQSVEEKILFELPINWYNDKFKGFAICCVTRMGAGACSPDSGLSEKYDYAFIKTKLACKDDLEDLKVLEKECKVGTASRTSGLCVCFVYIPLYASLQVSGTDVANINQYSLFEASIHGRMVRQWGVHLIYQDERTVFAKKYGTLGFTPLKRKRG